MHVTSAYSNKCQYLILLMIVLQFVGIHTEYIDLCIDNEGWIWYTWQIFDVMIGKWFPNDRSMIWNIIGTFHKQLACTTTLLSFQVEMIPLFCTTFLTGIPSWRARGCCWCWSVLQKTSSELSYSVEWTKRGDATNELLPTSKKLLEKWNDPTWYRVKVKIFKK